jgi:hypothetical protein
MWCSMVWVIPWSGTKHLVSIFLKKWTLACTAWHTPCLAPNSAASPASGLRRPPPHSAAHLDASAARLPSPNPTPPARLLGTRPGRRLPPPTASPTPPALATRLNPPVANCCLCTASTRASAAHSPGMAGDKRGKKKVVKRYIFTFYIVQLLMLINWFHSFLTLMVGVWIAMFQELFHWPHSWIIALISYPQSCLFVFLVLIWEIRSLSLMWIS